MMWYNVRRHEDGMLMLGASVDTEEEAEAWLRYYNQRYGDRYIFTIVNYAPRFTIDLRELLMSMLVEGHA